MECSAKKTVHNITSDVTAPNSNRATVHIRLVGYTSSS